MTPERKNENHVWQGLTPEKALEIGERILAGIEKGEFAPEAWETLVERLITFSDNGNGRDEVSPQPEKKESGPPPNQIRHQKGLAQLSPVERETYSENRKRRQSIVEANRDGRPRVKNPKRKY